MIKIEFFHDVICSFCFPMSYQVRKLQEKMPELEIVHRSFALIRDESDFSADFGSRGEAKDEIIKHWAQANQIDELHRFNIEGMQKADFLFPTSMPGLTACKAAGIVQGSGAYWDLFDALQRSFFMESKNVESLAVIEACVSSVGLDLEKWRHAFESPETKQAVEEDFALVEEYGITSVPSLVVNQSYKLVGVQTAEGILGALKELQ